MGPEPRVSFPLNRDYQGVFVKNGKKQGVFRGFL